MVFVKKKEGVTTTIQLLSEKSQEMYKLSSSMIIISVGL